MASLWSSLWLRMRLSAPRSALGWLLCAFLSHGLCLRLLAIDTVLHKWANTHQRTYWISILGLAVGTIQDACVWLGVSIPLWLGGTVLKSRQVRRLEKSEGSAGARVPRGSSDRASSSTSRELQAAPTIRPWLLALLVAIHFVVANIVFCIDLVFLRTRQMRFRWDFVALYWRELHRHHGDDTAVAQLQVDEAEWLVAAQMAGATMLFTVMLALQLDDRAKWLQSPLSEWDTKILLRARACVTFVVAKCSHLRRATTTTKTITSTSTAAGVRLHDHERDAHGDDAALFLPSSLQHQDPTNDSSAPSHHHDGLLYRLARLLLLWLTLVASTVALTKCVPSVVAMIAWNASLCEPLRAVVGVECIHTRPLHMNTKKLRELIDTTTEQCEFLDTNPLDSLVRKTHGFHGPLAFDVQIQPQEKPNVLVVVIESFRQRDSRYLLDPQHLDTFLPGNVSLTPQFDHWTSRGIGFRNMWSSWRTSRSLETILFGQLPLDSATDSGTSYGRANVRLSGLPQLLKAKGYDTLFTTGSRLDYDDWDVFLATHGFDTCLTGWDLADIGLDELGIDWTEGDRMMAFWGFHDDLSFEVLAHLLQKRQRAKKTTTKTGGKPWFATHYTISSHVPFDERPDWFYRLKQSHQLLDFSPLYSAISDPEIRELVQNYAEMRFFTDLAFGSFMAQLERSGVLNDTIVIVTGDHGHAPERGVAMPEEDQVGAMNVAAALIAEGRLGESAGTIIEDVAAHYDWLNTVADIIGVPQPDGFLQTGVGRSLKRKPVDTGKDRVVYSHNPALNLAAVQHHTRIEFFSDVPDVMRVYNVQRDPHRQYDLLSELPAARRHEIEQICDEARVLNDYFTQRWHEDCVLPPFCRNPDAVKQ